MTRRMPHPCRSPECPNPRLPGKGSRYCQEHRDAISYMLKPKSCQHPGCDKPKAPGRGSKLCQEHRDNAYQRQLERLRKTACFMDGCPEPKLPGKYRYCARHSAEGPQRERAQVLRRSRERQYGLTHDEYMALLEAQGGACAICGGSAQQRALAVDHDHVTSAIRGLLCDRCNPMLGYARDSIAILEAAIEYLKRNQVLIPPHCV